MSTDNKKQQLYSMLAGKSTAELEELLSQEAAEFDATGANSDVIAAALDLISERDNTHISDSEMIEKAWAEFQEYYNLRKQEERETDRYPDATDGDVYINPFHGDLWIVDGQTFVKINDGYTMELKETSGFIKIGHVDNSIRARYSLNEHLDQAKNDIVHARVSKADSVFKDILAAFEENELS